MIQFKNNRFDLNLGFGATHLKTILLLKIAGLSSIQENLM